MNIEDKIVKLFQSYYQDSTINNKLIEVRRLQLEFFSDCINRHDNKYVQSAFIDLLINIELILPINITYYAASYPSKCVIISNHLGIGKLAKIYPEDFRTSKNSFLPNNDSFIFLGFPLFYYLLIKQHVTFNSFRTLSIPYESKEISALQDQISVVPTTKSEYRKILTNKELTNLLIFPEGGTSGKRNQIGIYSLEEFNDGFIKLSKKLRMDILPIIQYLNKKGEYELIILETKNDETSLDLKIRMQNEMNKLIL
ncbi:hypothetical protein VB264_15765 [Arcicella aquatica]|uniref:Phospholipid/glycerol acyltransferase domain-containing protein n=1 Tax=Arcicella aquatica TaxID=217141 RepID=A0ABU5QR86_9BACT|nr:hypothetical protein [Arcicella aquatica]MEA5259254.1 hypothetical protein [Arcicella aquatica]